MLHACGSPSTLLRGVLWGGGWGGGACSGCPSATFGLVDTGIIWQRSVIADESLNLERSRFLPS